MKDFLTYSFLLAVFFAVAGAPSALYPTYERMFSYGPVGTTIVFAVYALALLVALLVFGRLSDVVGRRSVVAAAVLIELASLAGFLLASNFAGLVVSRIVQGIATGLVTAAVSAALIDFQPKNRPGLALLLNSILPLISLGVGSLGGALLVTFVPGPTTTVYVVLIVLLMVGLGGLALGSPTPSKGAPRWGLFVPSVSLAPESRGPFAAMAPALVAGWALGGVFLALVPSVAGHLLKVHNPILGAALIALLNTAGSLTSASLGQRSNLFLIRLGSTFAVLGLGVTAAAVLANSLPLLVVGIALAGVGFGPSFTGAFRTVMASAPADQRAGVASVLYVLSYLAFSVPVIAAGFAARAWGLTATFAGYLLISGALYFVTLFTARPAAKAA